MAGDVKLKSELQKVGIIHILCNCHDLPQISKGENHATSHIFSIELKQLLHVEASCQILQRFTEIKVLV